MNHIIVFAVLGIATYFAFKFNVILGIVVLALILLLLYKINYAAFFEMKANMEFQNGNIQNALKLYEKAYNSKNRKFSVDVSYARALLRSGNTEKALELMNNILSLSLSKEMKTTAKQTRCLINYKLGNIDEAYEEAYELYYDYNFTTSNMRGLMGFMMLLKGVPMDETIKFCEEAYDYDSDNRDIVDNLAVCCYKTKDYKKGLELCEDLTDEHPKFVEGWYHGAQMLSALGEKKRALEWLEKITECNRTGMTTVSEEEIDELKKQLS